MPQTALRLGFYVITGTILGSISWGSINHSVVTGDYALAIIFMGMMFYIGGKFFVDRWRPVHRQKDFHPTLPWKMPYTTTRRGLWFRVGFSTIVGMVTYSIVAFGLVMTTTAQPPFMIILGMLILLRVPHLYWSMRGRYRIVTTGDSPGMPPYSLHYIGGSELHEAIFWLIPVLMAGAGVSVAIIGVLMH